MKAKITVVGAGNVGGLTAMRLAENGLGDITLMDIAKNLASAKALDMRDARWALKTDYSIKPSGDFKDLRGADIVVVTAGFARKPGMSREELLNKNAQVIKEVSSAVSAYAKDAICVIVTNPVDVMASLFLKELGGEKKRVFGMGTGLDSSRFANLISEELRVDLRDVKALVIGAHGEGMIPLSRLSLIKDKPLVCLVSPELARGLEARTVARGAEIVNLYGAGSAYFAPSAAILEIVKSITGNTNETIAVSGYLEGEYGISGVCIGVPAKIGKDGISQIVKLDLNKEELAALQKSAESIKASVSSII